MNAANQLREISSVNNIDSIDPRDDGSIDQQNAHNFTILLVDDEPESLEEMSLFLKRKGYVCKTATNASDAIDIIKSDLSIHVVFTDICMPGMSGLNLLRHLRQTMVPERTLEIIVLTGHAGRDEAIEALQSGAMDFLLKPISLKQLSITAERAADVVRLRKIEKDQKESLESALEQERNLNQMQRDFISMVSHEFRTPLAIIDSIAQRIVRQKTPMTSEILSEKVSIIRSTVKKMTGLIDETLCVSRHEGGMLEISTQPCDIKYILQGICDSQMEINNGRTVTFNSEGLPDIIHADPNHLEHIFTNLVSNAIKYSDQDQPVEVQAWSDSNGVSVSVMDNGFGIPGNEIPFIFNRFYRASTSSGITGTGVGLYLVKILTELHGGCIEIDSTVGQGTTMIVCLPNNPKQPSDKTPGPINNTDTPNIGAQRTAK
ncbi:MAG: response regulator [Rhodospirillaceae bacterium]|nr:response regulator [Rhodospirillaceae bacterium]